MKARRIRSIDLHLFSEEGNDFISIISLTANDIDDDGFNGREVLTIIMFATEVIDISRGIS